MKKIVTAIGNPMLNEKLKNIINIEVIGNDIQYEEGIFEVLEKNKEVEFLILGENIIKELTIEKMIEKIKVINKNIKIIIVLENKKEELENILISKGIYKILYNNQIEINDFIKLINNYKKDENEELKKEIDDLKKLIIENQKEQNNKMKNVNLTNNILTNINLKNKLIKFKNILFQEINITENNKQKEEKNNISEKEIISISGPSGVGKSIISINLAKSMMYQKEKILIIDFDILNNNLHTILGVKKYPSTRNDNLNKLDKLDNLNNSKNSNINNIDIQKLIIKINKKIDLISATDMLFNTKQKIDLIKIENILNKLKEKYNTIIIDTSSECFFDFTKTIIKLSNKNIFVTETNILEIKKAKELLKIYINQWKIDKNKFNILFNKYDKDCINMNLLKELFCEFNIIGTLKYNTKYNRLINKNIKNSLNKEIRNEYLNLKIR